MPPSAEVHRRLPLATPIEKGPDVGALQAAINEQYDHFKIDRAINHDHELGRETFGAAREIAFSLGITGGAEKKLGRGVLSEGAQKLIRGRKRTHDEELAAARREDYRKDLRKRYSKSAGEKAIELSNSLVGIHEVPAGSNLGPGNITVWEQFTGYAVDDGDSAGVFWCGCFACWVVVKLGGANIPERIRMGYAPNITVDAQAGRNGFRAVPINQARAGDVICLWGGEHIEVVRADYHGGGLILARGGNTSEGGKSNNGGQVADNSREIGDVDGGIAARPAWA